MDGMTDEQFRRRALWITDMAEIMTLKLTTAEQLVYLGNQYDKAYTMGATDEIKSETTKLREDLVVLRGLQRQAL